MTDFHNGRDNTLRRCKAHKRDCPLGGVVTTSAELYPKSPVEDFWEMLERTRAEREARKAAQEARYEARARAKAAYLKEWRARQSATG